MFHQNNNNVKVRSDIVANLTTKNYVWFEKEKALFRQLLLLRFVAKLQTIFKQQ